MKVTIWVIIWLAMDPQILNYQRRIKFKQLELTDKDKLN
jgi:hypothetical protein